MRSLQATRSKEFARGLYQLKNIEGSRKRTTATNLQKPRHLAKHTLEDMRSLEPSNHYRTAPKALTPYEPRFTLHYAFLQGSFSSLSAVAMTEPKYKIPIQKIWLSEYKK